MQDSSLFARLKQLLSTGSFVSQKLLWSTGKAAWVAGTTFLILCVPLIIEMDREQQLMDLETQQGLLTGGPTPAVQPSGAVAAK